MTMHEDELLQGLVEAAAYGGWLVTHARRSDLALTMGAPGFPDLVGVHEERKLLIAWELKADRGTWRPGQRDWLAGFEAAGADVRTVRPDGYDAAALYLLGDRVSSGVLIPPGGVRPSTPRGDRHRIAPQTG